MPNGGGKIMDNISRRSFLKYSALALTGIAAHCLYPSNGGSQTTNSDNSFQMLVMGDSVMWGQGLHVNNKFWYLTKKWLETEVYQNRRLVNAHIEAHSGATIIEQKRDRKSYIDPLRKFNGEINIGTPTILRQVDDALAYYKSQGIAPESVELVLLDGAANDLSLPKLVLPQKINFNFRTNIKKYCYTKMLGLLGKIADVFPNARIVVTGYYPIVSEKTDKKHICNLLGSLGERDACNSKWISKGLDWVLAEMALTSDVWYQDSNQHLQAAVDEINRAKPLKNQTPFSVLPESSQAVPANAAQRAFFAKVNFGKENAFAAENTYLWKVERFSDRDFSGAPVETNQSCPDIRKSQLPKIIETNDELFGFRNPYCNCRDLRYKGFILESCYAAGTGHPNKEGAKEFARAIKFQLTGDKKYQLPAAD